MVQHCVNAACTDFGSYTSAKKRDVAEVVASKSTSVNNALDHHIRTLGSVHAGSIDFVSNVLPGPVRSYSSISSEQANLSYKTNTAGSSSSSSGYESVSSKSHKSLFYRLKRLINFPTTRKSSDYQISSLDRNKSYSPALSFRNPSASSGIFHSKSSRRTLPATLQHIPFLYGLKNCGNTCYINAILQCLCHTEQIASYILEKSYELDIRNIKNALVEPPNFRVTKLFIQIFQTLWTNSSNTTSKLLYDFKSILANLNKQYSGNEQNDAQEFLLFLINTIHDELNLASTRHHHSSSSTELARRAWLEYLEMNQSIITSTFSAQLHSTLRCHQCQKESKTFEPYLLLSLPIPQKIIRPVFITVVFLNQSPKQLQIGLCLPITNTVKDVREAIAQQSNLDPNDLVLLEIQQENGFSQVFHDTEPITRLGQDIYAIQFPSIISAENAEKSASIIENSPGEYVNLLVLNRVQYTSGRIARFGAPIAVRVSRQSTYRALQIAIIKAQHSLVRDDILEYAQKYVVFQLALIDQYQSISKEEYPIHSDLQWPLYLEKLVEILDTYDGPGLGPSHIQVYATWNEKYLTEFLSRWSTADDKPDIHESVAQARATLHQSTSPLISLADCFSLFTQSESLNYDDAWMCTHCRRKENGTVKHLQIWSTPPVLIIHLKRFCQTKLSNSKLTYPVEFPLVDFNVKRFLSTNNELDERDYGFYDLYAVCNHRGSMSNGHYTAYCQNPMTGKWFCYDDHLVSEIDPARVCTPDAYILFYKRRETPPSSLASSEQQIDSIIDEFDDHLNVDQSSSSVEDKKPLPLPRKFLPNQDQSLSVAPCPMPRSRPPQTELNTIDPAITSINELTNESSSRYNNPRYSNDEIESNVR